VTLDGGGDDNAVFIFQVDAALNTTASSVVRLTNGAVAGNCVLQIASVTAGQTTTVFAGSFWKARRVLGV